jgi:hypothetical protein
MTRKPIEIRIPSGVGKQLREELFRFGRHERVVFSLVSSAETIDNTLILVKKIHTLHEEQYVETRFHGAMWRGSSTLHIINEAIERKLGIFVFHAHDHRGKVGLSQDDLQSAQALLPSYQNIIPWRPHGSIVIGKEHAAGIVLLPDAETMVPISRLRWLDNAIVDWDDETVQSLSSTFDRMYARQVLLIGGKGQQSLKKAKIAVVGLSGGGSHIVQQAAHLGIGEIIGIDADRVEEENRHRLIGGSRFDVLLKRKKTQVMRRLVTRINRNVRFTPIPYNVPDQVTLDQLKRADIIVGCVDSLQTRSDLQEISQRYLIPYVDIGLLIVPNQGSQFIGGNVLSLIPGRFCMWCIGYLSERKLAEETGGKPRSYFQGAPKQAQVVSFNGLLSSAAMNEVLHLITGYRPESDLTSIKKFDGNKGTLEDWDVNIQSNCPKCDLQVAAGDIVWSKLR